MKVAFPVTLLTTVAAQVLASFEYVIESPSGSGTPAAVSVHTLPTLPPKGEFAQATEAGAFGKLFDPVIVPEETKPEYKLPSNALTFTRQVAPLAGAVKVTSPVRTLTATALQVLPSSTYETEFPSGSDGLAAVSVQALFKLPPRGEATQESKVGVAGALLITAGAAGVAAGATVFGGGGVTERTHDEKIIRHKINCINF